MKKKKGQKMGLFNSVKTQRQKRRLANKSKSSMKLICLSKDKKCDEEGFNVKVGNLEHLFCCEKGFKYSLEDFKKQL